MQILVPEKSFFLTPKGFCFPDEIIPGTEILILNNEKKLIPYTIIEEIQEPKLYQTKTLLSNSLTFTLIPNYKIYHNDELRDFSSLEIGNVMPILNKNFIKNFEKIQDELSEINSKISPISATCAKYLTQCKLDENRQQVVFPVHNEESARELGKKIKEELVKDIGGDVTYRAGIKNYHTWKKSGKTPSHKIFFDNNEFYEIRKKFNFNSDMIDNQIYSNGFYLFFIFLQNFLTDGYQHHIQYFVRNNDKLLFSLLWSGKLRKLLQNTCLIWKKYQLSFHSTNQINVNELQLIPNDIDKTHQIIVHIKEQSQKCYKIDIPFNSELIIDFMHVKPFELNDSEIEQLQKPVKTLESNTNEINFEQIRKQIISNLPRNLALKPDSAPFETINQILGDDKWKLHIVGKFDRKGIVYSSSTRYGQTSSLTGFLSDETGEIKIKLWGNIVHKLQNGNIIELVGGYVKNGILYNKRGGRTSKINPKNLTD